MGWFDEQLRVRKQQDEDYLESAIEHLVGSVTGKRMGDAFDTSAIDTTVLEAVLRCLGIKAKLDPMPESFSLTEAGVADQDEQMEYRLRPFGVMWRRVELEDEWYRNATGPLAGRLKEDGTVVALLPNKLYGYSLFNYRTGERIKLNRRTDELLDREAVSFYKPFPLRKISIKDLVLFMLSQLTTADIVLYLLSIAVVTAVGTISPLITKLLFSDVLASNSTSVLVAMAVFAMGYCLCQVMLAAFKALVQTRVTAKVSLAVQSATMNRVMQLPASFFKDYAAGDLSQRMSYVQALCGSLMNSIGNTGLTAVFSLVYIGQVFVFAPSMVIPALGITLASAVLSAIIALRQMTVTREMMSYGLQESAVSYATISGVQKIKLSGSEKRMFARWLDIYAKKAALQYNPPLFLRLSVVLTTAVSLAGTAILYYVALRNNVSIADYYAFTTAYGMVSGAFMALAGVVTTIATIRPTLEMAKPLLDAEPEISEGKKILSRLGGNIEMSHVSFRYSEDAPWVLDDVSFEVGRGEYVAVVGKTGCGKSTLLRLLLGFETPQKGSIYYDGVQLTSIDPKSLRRRIGTVMQDGKLFKGDIYSNIVISAPTLSLDEAWEAAETAAIADDIRAMPMGMHTMVSEGQGGISGGQRQRLMIARAIAPKPSVLMFDEATSALDNLTQKHVSESLDAMKCTRIVIAHRLSTIRHCDRIIVLDGGKIAETGTYEELIEKNGFFADLVARQRIDA